MPSDVIILRAGDKVPADRRLLNTVNLPVEEAVLTGEAVPVKNTRPRWQRQSDGGRMLLMAWAQWPNQFLLVMRKWMMKGRLRVLIAYDGSACADAALDDLRRAGLPAVLEAVVVTVADVIPAPLDGAVAGDERCLARIPEAVRHAQGHAEKAVKEARVVAERAVKRVKADFPGWEVWAEAHGDTPAWAVIKVADRYETDLSIVGSHRRSMIGGRFILGSVSQRVLYAARCSVRVARCSDERRGGPVRIVVGFNGSPGAEVAVAAVAARTWPVGSEARFVIALGTAMPAQATVPADKLCAAGLSMSKVTREGSPGRVLLDEVEKWGADALFVGTRDLHGMKHFLHGSVSSAVAAHAACSVEVVRPGRSTATVRG